MLRTSVPKVETIAAKLRFLRACFYSIKIVNLLTKVEKRTSIEKVAAMVFD